MNHCENFKQLSNDECKDETLINHDFFKHVTTDQFSKEKNRLIFSRFFRRLEHKAQLYSIGKGDHFRTRLTHTLEVAQIARSLSKNLQLNEDLTEAIALGHDIGHAPFGHQGERTLNEIMCGSNDLAGKIKTSLDHGGFKHNYYSLRILDVIEKNFNSKDFNFSWQTMEGILKHTKLKNKNGDKYNINKFVNDELLKKYLILNQDFSVTLEGQIVDIADEIAQRQHDLDDGMRDHLSNLKVDDVYNKLIKIIDEIIIKHEKSLNEDCSRDKDHIKKCIELIKILKKNLEKKKDNNDLNKKDTLIIDIIEYFVLDVSGTVMNTINLEKNNYEYSINWNNIPENMFKNFIIDLCGIGSIKATEICKFIHINKDEKPIEIMIDLNNKKAILKISDDRTYEFKIKKENGKLNIYSSIFKKKIVCFSEIGNDFNHKIEKYIRNEVLVSDHLNKFDGKARYIILRLFRAYYENPFQMPYYMLERLKKTIDKNANIYKLKLRKNNEFLNEINFKNSNKDTKEEIFSILKMDIGDKLITPEGFDKKNFLNDKELLKKINETEIKKLKSEYGITGEFIKCILENNYAYLSTICDYIAGMTDNYARKEYKELYLAD